MVAVVPTIFAYSVRYVNIQEKSIQIHGRFEISAIGTKNHVIPRVLSSWHIFQIYVGRYVFRACIPCQKILCHWLSGLLAPYKNKMKKRFLCPQLNFSITQINFPLINSIHYTSKHHWHPPLMQLSDLLMIVICIITNHEDFLLSYFFP